MTGLLFRGLGRLNDWVCRICTTLIMVLLSAIVVILFGSVFWRYFLNDPISWSEDAALLCMIWMTLLGAPARPSPRQPCRHGDVALRIPSTRSLRSCEAVISLVILTTAAVVVYYGGPFVKQGMARIIPSIDWLSQGYAYLALPVGFALLIPICAEQLIQSLIPAKTDPVEG